MRRAAALVLALLLVLPTLPSRADKPRQASGTFEGKNWTFEAIGALAFPSEVGMDDQPGIRVAVSNSGFKAEYFEHIWDREHVVDTYFKDDETLVVYFHFSTSGKYEGMSYYFGSGDGCGFCYDGAVQSTVKVEKGRIHGKVVSKPKPGEVSFDLAFDVPVATADYGKALPAGFGEPGKMYAAYHQALEGDSPQALATLLAADGAANLAEHGEQVLASCRENHPTKSYRITKGWTRENRTLLLVEGENAYMKVKSEVHLLLESGSWRIEDEISQLRMDE